MSSMAKRGDLVPAERDGNQPPDQIVEVRPHRKMAQRQLRVKLHHHAACFVAVVVFAGDDRGRRPGIENPWKFRMVAEAENDLVRLRHVALRAKRCRDPRIRAASRLRRPAPRERGPCTAIASIPWGWKRSMILINSAVRTSGCAAHSRGRRSSSARVCSGAAISGATAESCRATSGRIEFSAAAESRNSQSSGPATRSRISLAIVRLNPRARAADQQTLFRTNEIAGREGHQGCAAGPARRFYDIPSWSTGGFLVRRRAQTDRGRRITGRLRPSRISRNFMVSVASVKGF